MPVRTLAFGVAILAVTGGAFAQSPTRRLADTLRAMDAAFICPEKLATDDARQAEVTSFGRLLGAQGLSYAQAVKVRANFLARHGCGQPVEISAAAISGTAAVALPR